MLGNQLRGPARRWHDDGAPHTGERDQPCSEFTGPFGAITAIAVGNSHACAVTNLGGVVCWGTNTYGELGDGTTKNYLFPGEVWGFSE